ncbi:MAG: polysaccharide biosynthesis C-terminal domain-containing protein [Chitinophagaceae bacterium]
MRKITRFFDAVFLLLLLNFLVKPLWILGIDRKVQLLTGELAYGHYFSTFNFVFIFGIVADLGLSDYLRRTIAIRNGIDKHSLMKFVQLKLMLSLFMAILVLGVGYAFGIRDITLLTGLILLQIILGWIGASRAVISGLQLYQTDAWLSIADKLMLVVVGVFLLYVFPISFIRIDAFLSAQLMSAALTFLISVFVLVRYFKKNPFLPDASTGIATVLNDTLPFAMLFFVMSVHLRADGFLLGVMQPNTTAAGTYASMYRFLDATHVAATLVGSYLVAFWSRHLQERELLRRSLHEIFSLMVSVALAIILFVFFYADQVYEWFYHQQDGNGANLLRWGMFALFPYAIVSVFGSMLTAKGHLKLFIYIVLFCAASNVVLNVFVIPTYGAIGAAFIANSTQSALAILLFIFLRKKEQLGIAKIYLIRLLFFLAILLVLLNILRYTYLSLFWQVFSYLVLTLITANRLKMIPAGWRIGMIREK